MTAEEYLSQYRECVDDIKCKREELSRLLEDATAMQQAGETAHIPGSVSDKVGKNAAAIADLKREIEEEIAAAHELRRDIRKSIAAISSRKLRRLLTYRYICGNTWERVATKLGKSYQHVYTRLRPQALAKIGDTGEKS